jgi:hypothetical protein
MFSLSLSADGGKDGRDGGAGRLGRGAVPSAHSARRPAVLAAIEGTSADLISRRRRAHVGYAIDSAL